MSEVDQVETGFPKSCLHCERAGLELAESVKSHNRDKHKKLKEPCVICGYFFMNNAEYEQHYNDEHSTKKVHRLQKKDPKRGCTV